MLEFEPELPEWLLLFSEPEAGTVLLRADLITCILHVALTPDSICKVMVAIPSCFPCTFPLEVIVAIFLSLDIHSLTLSPCVFDFILIVWLLPISTVTDFSFREILLSA